jgi:predicted alpha/beta-hydrolase family hydrolase
MARARGTVLLFPGAGADRNQSTLVRLETDLAPAWTTVRCDFPYRKAGRRAPDKPAVLMAAVRAELAGIRTRRVVVGGRSMGGRICSMVAAGADGQPPPRSVAALVAISYPLHPPGRPDRLRVEHLADLHVPCLFVHGTADPFGAPEELARWTATIPGPVTHHWVEGRGHDLKGRDAEVAATVREFLNTLP